MTQAITRESRDSRDFISLAVAATSGNPEAERIHEKGAECVMAVYRLVKLALLHTLDNQAVSRTVEQSHTILRDFATMANMPATVTYAGDTIFVCGQLLKASRGIYESAVELGGLMSRCGVSETSFEVAVMPQDLLEFAGLCSTALRDPERRGALVEAKLRNIIARPVDKVLERRDDNRQLALRERIVRFYASALVVMRQFYDSIRAGTMLLPHRVKRLAQQIVTLSQEGDAAMLGVTAMANAHRDDAGRAVQSAILAVVLGHRITKDRVSLSRLAMAALMADMGRARLTGTSGRDRLVRLGDSMEASVPPVTAAAAIAAGGVNAPNALRSTTMYEATFLEREELLGPLYERQMPVLVHARILQLVRALLDRLAPRDASSAMGPLEAMEQIVKLPGIDPALVRLLIGVLGVLPVGSVVELETREWAVVVGASSMAGALDRPRICLVTDKAGRVLEHGAEVDLGAPPDGKRYPPIVRVVPPKEARFNVARVFVE